MYYYSELNRDFKSHYKLAIYATLAIRIFAIILLGGLLVYLIGHLLGVNIVNGEGLLFPIISIVLLLASVLEVLVSFLGRFVAFLLFSRKTLLIFATQLMTLFIFIIKYRFAIYYITVISGIYLSYNRSTSVEELRLMQITGNEEIYLILVIFGFSCGIILKYGISKSIGEIATFQSGYHILGGLLLCVPALMMIPLLNWFRDYINYGPALGAIICGIIFMQLFEKLKKRNIYKVNRSFIGLAPYRDNYEFLKNNWYEYKVYEHILYRQPIRALCYLAFSKIIHMRKESSINNNYIDDRDAISYLACIYFLLGFKKMVIRLYESNKQINRLTSIAGICYFIKGQYENALTCLQSQIEYNNSSEVGELGKRANYYLYHNLSIIYYDKGEMEDARDCAKQALSISNKYSNSIVTKAHLYLLNSIVNRSLDEGFYESVLAGDAQKRMECWGEMLEINRNVEMHYEKMKSYFPKYSQLMFDSANLDYIAILAYLMILTKNYSEARALLRRCYTIDPFYIRTLFYYGFYYYSKKQNYVSMLCNYFIASACVEECNERYRTIALNRYRIARFSTIRSIILSTKYIRELLVPKLIKQ